GHTQIKCGLYEQAAKNLLQAADNPSVREKALHDAAVALFRAGRLEEAARAASDSLAINPGNQRARAWLWLTAHKMGGYPDYIPPRHHMELKVGFEKPRVEFEDIAAKIGLDKTSGGRGIAVFDYNNDGWPDLFVANDTEPNKLYKNNGNGTFTDEGIAAGVAFSEAGTPRAGMGVDAGDYDASGRQSIIIGNFTNESMALYRNEGTGLFTDEAQASGIGKMSAQSLTFACFFFDYDLDGLPDIFAANGHVSDDISVVQPNVKYAQLPHLFRNRGKRKFEEVTAKLGRSLQRAIVGRGAAYGDFDNDGDLDLLLTTNNGPARLLRNDNGNQNDLLRIKLAGTRSNRDGIGARVSVQTAGGAKLSAMVKTGSSYCSQSELPLTFGLGRAEDKSYTIEISWPSGGLDKIPDVKPNQALTIQEGKGITSAAPIVFAKAEPPANAAASPSPPTSSK
ncbi:MAG TPA: FG-GAP-like repeat-containing protein, partial [Pyrinomonadaceae bacterium]